MAPIAAQISQAAGYTVLAVLVVRLLRGLTRDAVFAALNLGFFFLIYFNDGAAASTAIFLGYLAFAGLQFAALKCFAKRQGWLPWVAFSLPLAGLIFARVFPTLPPGGGGFAYAAKLVGLSYMAFRASYLVLEVRNGSVTPPGLFRYFGFCFFLPTIPVGPINPYANHEKAFAGLPLGVPVGRAAMRILVGMVKYKYLGNLCFQLSYEGLLLDDHLHHWIDLPVAAVFFYLFLYCNFSGFCDIAIGVSGLIGIPVAENFNNPLAARNVKDFWNRWHITLSNYVRDVIFSPLTKSIARTIGPTHAVGIGGFVVFLLVGLWHGSGLNFLAFGALHGLALTVNHYYTLGLKKWLGRDRFKAYLASKWIEAAAIVLTFAYVAGTMFVFANSFPKMRELLALFR